MEQNSKIEIMKGYISVYIDLIEKFNKSLIDNYNLDCTPTYNEAGHLFPRMGAVSSDHDIYKYQYHGCGCTFEINGIMISYDIDVSNNNEIVIPEWYFYEFIKAYTKECTPIKLNDLQQLFFDLVEEGVLVQRSTDAEVFNINMNYYL